MKMLSKRVQQKTQLLRAKGNSYRDISKLLHISLGSTYTYSNKTLLSQAQKIKLKRRGYNKGIASLSEESINIARHKGGLHSPHHFQIKYSKAELIQLLRNYQEKYHRMPTKRDFYSYNSAFRRIFASWNIAIKEAGFSPNPVLFAKKYIANDGHKCDSFAEKIIDDWLFVKNILHERNVRYLNTRYTADFKIGDIFVEFFGLHGQLKRYDVLMKRKLKLIKQNKLKLISLFPDDLFPKSKLDVVLKRLNSKSK
ncbi:MAG: hypothetical protein AAB492_04900 [Patescibacteria group bacterium]